MSVYLLLGAGSTLICIPSYSLLSAKVFFQKLHLFGVGIPNALPSQGMSCELISLLGTYFHPVEI